MDDIFEVIWTLDESETRHIRSENHPIKNKKILNILASRLAYKNNYIADPKRAKAEAIVNKVSIE